MLHNILKMLSSLHRLLRSTVRLTASLLKAAPWAIGPLLGLAAYCPLYYFALAGSWLPHLLGISLLWTAWLLIRQQDYRAAWFGAWILLATSSLIGAPEPPAASLQPNGQQLRLAQVNVLQFNLRHDLVTQHILQLDADILAFQEVDQLWADSLVKALAREYPYFSLAPQDNCYGMALFSRKPLKEVKLRFWEGYPAISAILEDGDTESLILSLHAASPVSRERYQARNKQLASAARLIEQTGLPTLLIGDLNTVPWDAALSPLLESARLQDSRARHYTATWPNFMGRWGIPIDYVLHSSEWQRLSHSVHRIPGSDHRAMVATLALKPTKKLDQNILLLTQN